MIFVGDISLPEKDAIKLIDFPEELLRQKWIGNLEGALVEDSSDLRKRLIVYNDIEAFYQLTKYFDFHGFLLANNHIFDCGKIERTNAILKELNLSSVGITNKKTDNVEFMEFRENGQSYIVLNFGWEVIQCEIAKNGKGGVEPLEISHVVNSFKNIASRYRGHKIIVTFHWNYELEAYPHPRERELSKYLIDLGAAAIIGGHPHRIGGFEVYKDRPIVFSLGNWLFAQNYYNQGKLKFPDFCNKELALEYNLNTNKIKFHFFEYNRKEATLTYLNTENIDSRTMSDLTPYRNMEDSQYSKWYTKHRFHKKKGLPIYYWNDSNAIIACKDFVVRFRDLLIKLVFALKLK